MNELITVGVKAVNGGLFVVALALVGEMAVPKRFAGLFSAAPSVALANLLVIVAADGAHQARREATGMIVGAVAMCAACAAGVGLVRRYRATRGSVMLCGVWLALAGLGYVVVFR